MDELWKSDLCVSEANKDQVWDWDRKEWAGQAAGEENSRGGESYW